MNCYYSPQNQAVGICKSCGRGISFDFAADVGNGLACKDRCEDRVKTINRMIDRNSKVLSITNTQLRRNMIFSAVSGVLFAIFGVYMGFRDSGLPGIIFVALGVAFILRGVLSYTRAAKYPTDEK